MSELTPPVWLEDFDPTEFKAWAEDHLSKLSDKCEWGVPSNGTVYVIDKVNKTIVMKQGIIDDWFWKNTKVFGQLGYKVTCSLTLHGHGKTGTLGNLRADIARYRQN